jgi:cobaltochelatase CobN
MTHDNNGGIVLLSHAGTDLTALGRVHWPQDFSPVSGIALQHIADETHMQQLLDGPLASARILLLRVLGRVQAIPGFDAAAPARHRPASGADRPQRHRRAGPGTGRAQHRPPGHPADANAYLQAGGSSNMAQLMRYLSDRLLLTGHGYLPPAALPEHGLYHPELSDGCSLDDWCEFASPAGPRWPSASTAPTG